MIITLSSRSKLGDKKEGLTFYSIRAECGCED